MSQCRPIWFMHEHRGHVMSRWSYRNRFMSKVVKEEHILLFNNYETILAGLGLFVRLCETKQAPIWLRHWSCCCVQPSICGFAHGAPGACGPSIQAVSHLISNIVFYHRHGSFEKPAFDWPWRVLLIEKKKFCKQKAMLRHAAAAVNRRNFCCPVFLVQQHFLLLLHLICCCCCCYYPLCAGAKMWQEAVKFICSHWALL